MEEEPRKFVVHGLEPMTTKQLSQLACGHCMHPLTAHLTYPAAFTRCAYCHCLRHPGEDILKPHNFTQGA